MRAPIFAAEWSRAAFVFCLMTTAVTAQSQNGQPLEVQASTSKSRPIAAPKAKPKAAKPADPATPKKEQTRWERFRNQISPNGEKESREADRQRWLLDRKIRYAPEPDTIDGNEVKPDVSVLKSSYEMSQGLPQLPNAPAMPTLDSLPVAAPASAVGIAADPNYVGVAPTQSPTMPPAMLPLVDQPHASATSDGMAPAASESLPDPVLEPEPYSLTKRFFRGYPTLVDWFPKHLGPPRERDTPDPEKVETFRAGERGGGGGYESPGAPRRSPPSPWDSPPFPSSEYQGYPLIGTPQNPGLDPLYEALLRGPFGQEVKDSRVEVHGWVTTSGNWSNAIHSNLPTAYWVVPNSFQLDQFLLKFEREIDWVQTDHIDWGFKSTHLYGIDYRFTTAGGVFSQQLLYHNQLYGYDPVEFWAEVYIPRIFEGFVIRCGRWIACPDIEAQYAPDNYLASHSILFAYDTYTQTGCMFSCQVNQRNMIQGAIQAGTDMAPWYPGATPTGFFGWRWVSKSNKDAFYTCLNNINNAHFRYFWADGHKAGHDNFNYIVTTWEHTFSKKAHTKTEAYYMWQFDSVVGGTPSLGAPRGFGGGGGLGTYLPGNAPAYGVLNYSMFQLSKRDYMTFRNEWYNDQRGERTGFATNYTSNTFGISHQFNDLVMIRPEIGFYHSWNVPAFDLGKKSNLLMYGFDFTVRF